MIRAIRDVFGLSEEERIVPEFARYEAALGAALKASGSVSYTHLLVQNWPVLAGRQVRSVCVPVRTVP